MFRKGDRVHDKVYELYTTRLVYRVNFIDKDSFTLAARGQFKVLIMSNDRHELVAYSKCWCVMAKNKK